jgi:hypothetical protein
MKKLFVFALLFAAVAGAAQAYVEPTPNQDYYCDYVNPPAPSADPGLSFFTITRSLDPSGLPIWRGTEYFDATWGGTDNRKVTFAKPANMYFPDLNKVGTRWEFTINPSGPQCKSTDIVNDGYGGQDIYFRNCTDGHTRVCHRLY